MVKFIRQEAEEKSNEIKVSAEEVREITIIIPNCVFNHLHLHRSHALNLRRNLSTTGVQSGEAADGRAGEG